MKKLTIHTLEDFIDSSIIERGADYFNSQKVNKITDINGKVWQAQVDGADLYDIEIHLIQKEIKGWLCSCPFTSGPMCKHVVAALFAITKIRNEAISKSSNQF